ncbi:MAG: LamG domain-containing protein [Rhizobacter sp.]|nr:LamG domain-containing protein [Ferruginibacter sp.]
MYFNKIRFILSAAVFTLLLAGCEKKERPELDPNYPVDQPLPGGDLRFFVPFGGTEEFPRLNSRDSISGHPAQISPLSVVPGGITGDALQGADGKAAKYLDANDFKSAGDFTMAFWMKSAARAGRTEFIMSLVQPGLAWHSSSLFILVENQTATSVTMKVAVKDQWLEGNFNRPMFDDQWHHIVYSFNNTDKKMTYYFDGVEVTGLANNQYNVSNAVSFSGASNLILGGWNKHGGAGGPNDDWVKSYNGLLDQFRLYNKALSASEAMALFTSKQ